MDLTVKYLLTIFSLVSLSACSSTLHVKLGYLPEASKKSPLGTLKPLGVAIEIEDQRHTVDRELVGFNRFPAPGGSFYVTSDQKPATVLYNALKSEWENNGHRVVDITEASDLTVSMVLRRFWTTATYGAFDDEVTGTILVDLKIRTPQQNSGSFSKPVQSNFSVYDVRVSNLPQYMAYSLLTLGTTVRYNTARIFEKAHETALNGALTEFIRRFARDPGILKAIELAQREKSQEAERELSPGELMEP